MTVQRGRLTTPFKKAVRERQGNKCADCNKEPDPGDDNLWVIRAIPGSDPVGDDGFVALCPKCVGRRTAKMRLQTKGLTPPPLRRPARRPILINVICTRELKQAAGT